MQKEHTDYLTLAMLVLAMAPGTTLAQYAEKLELVGTVEYPHGWSVGFVKQGDYLFQTAGETSKKLRVIDASDPAHMKVVAKSEISFNHAAWQARLNGNMLLCNLYSWFVPVDVSDPLKPRTMLGCEWQPKPAGIGGAGWYGYNWRDDYLYLASADPKMAFRVYKVERTFRPRLIATIDMEQLAFTMAGSKLRESDILDWKGFLCRIRKQVRAEGPSPGKAVMKAFREAGEDLEDLMAEPGDAPSAMPEVPEVPDDQFKTRMLKALNKAVSDVAFYDPKAWDGMEVDERFRTRISRTLSKALGDAAAHGPGVGDGLGAGEDGEPAEQDPETDRKREELYRANRLALEAAFPYAIKNTLTSLLGRGPGGVGISGDMVHTRRGLFLIGIDVSHPDKPRVAYCSTLGEDVAGYARAGHMLYVSTRRYSTKRDYRGKRCLAGSKRGVLTVDFRNPQRPTVLGEYHGMDVPRGLLAHGEALFVTGTEAIPLGQQQIDGVPFGSGLRKSLKARPVMHVVDISNPGKMNRRFRYAFPIRDNRSVANDLGAMVVEDGLLYLGDNGYGIWVFDVQDPWRPRLRGKLCATSRETPGIILKGDNLYAHGSLGMLPVDVSNPKQPRLMGGVSLGGPLTGRQWAVPRDCERSRYLCIPGMMSQDVIVYDVADPAQPRVTDIATVPGKLGMAISLFEARDFVYVLSSTEQHRKFQFLAYKLDKEGRMHLVSQCDLPVERRIPWWGGGGGRGAPILCPAGNRVYVVLSRSPAGDSVSTKGTRLVFFTIDVSKGDAPKLIGKTVTEPVVSAVRRNSPAVFYKGYLYTAGRSRPGEAEREQLPSVGSGEGRPSRGVEEDDFASPTLLEEASRRAAVAGGKGEASLRACIFAFDVSEPNDVKLVHASYDPFGDNRLYSSLTVLSPHPCLVVQDYYTGLRLVDLSDPAKPEYVWREPVHTGYDFENYGRISWGSGVFREGRLYRSGLDHLDIFKLITRTGERPGRDTLEKQMTEIREALADGDLPPAAQASARVALKCIDYYAKTKRLQEAGLLAREAVNSLDGGPRIGEAAFTARRAKGEIVIDGDPREWKETPRIEFADGPATAGFQWDAKYLYLLLEAKDGRLEAPSGHDPACSGGDYVHVFVSGLPCPKDRPYGPADLGYVFPFGSRSPNSARNLRLRREQLHSQKGWLSRAGWRHTADGYVAEIALSHEETWLVPQEGAVVTGLPVVTDRGVGRWFLKPARWSRYDFGADWPRLRLVSGVAK